MKQARILQNIVGGSYEADSKIAGTAFSLNMYAENVEETSGERYYTTALRSREGERIVLEGLGGKCRGMFVASDGSIFAAFGSNFYRIRYDSVDEKFSRERIFKQVFEDFSSVSFSETGGVNSHVVWVDGSSLVYAYPLDTASAETQGISLPISFVTPKRVYLTSDDVVVSTGETVDPHIRPTQICSVKGCIVINDPDTDTWYYTEPYILGGTQYTRDVYDLDANGNVQYEEGNKYKVKTKNVRLDETDPVSGTSYIWLDRYGVPHWQTSELTADKNVGMKVCGDFLYILGERSVQAYAQTSQTDALGNSYMVFSSSSSNVNDIGCKDYRTISEISGTLVFLGSGNRGDGSVIALQGGTPARISTNAIEREIKDANLEDVCAFSFVEIGHSFYCITIPSLKKSYVYDFATRQWHNRSTSYGNGTSKGWWVKHSVKTEGKILLAGDVDLIAMLDASKYDDYKGDVIIKQRVSQIVSNDYSPFILNDIQLMLNTGESLDVNNEANARNPVVMLEISKDAGHNFNKSVWGYMGRIGEYSHRCIWRNLGKVTMAVLRFTISDRCKVVITGAKIGFTQLRNF